MENLTGYDNIVCKFALCIFNLLNWVVNFSRLFIWIQCCSCATREITVCYTTTTYEVHAFKNKNKRKPLLRDIFVYNFIVYVCLFVAVICYNRNTRLIICYNRNTESLLIIQSIWWVGSKAATGVLKAFLKNFTKLTGKNTENRESQKKNTILM